ncbi:MAG: alpha/beta hydrolase [Nocardioides sp.]
MHQAHRPVAAVVAALLGAVLAAAGAGAGIRYLVKTGLTVPTVVGLTLLVAGLVLLVFALSIGWRALHGWTRLGLVPGVVVGLAVMLSVALAVAFTVVPPTALGAATPASEGLAYRSVALTTADGVRLSAWLVPSRNGAAVVLLHGSGSTRTAELTQAGVLGRHGYGLLLVDARGHGRSGGRGMDLGWYGDLDVAAAVTFLTRQRGVDPPRIAVLGLSMGGEEAIGAAGRDPGIRAVVAEGATARTAADKSAWLPGGPSGAVQRLLDRLTYGLVDLLTPASPPAPLRDSVRAAVHTRFLMIAAGSMPDETTAAQVLRDAAPARVQVWTVPGAGHTGGLSTAPAAWRQRVLAFLDARLRPTGR